MKIGIISNLYPPYTRGGAENIVVRTVEELNNRDHEVFVISAKPFERGRDMRINNTTTEKIYQFFPKNLYFVLDDHRFRWLTRLPWHIIDAFSNYTAQKVEDIISSEKPDVIFTHNLKGLGLKVARAVQKQNFPHIHVVHDLQLIVPSGLRFAGHEKENPVTKVFYSLYRECTKWLLGQPDLVIFPSHFLQREYTSNGFFKKSQVVVLPNPAPSYNLVTPRRQPSGPLNLLFVGQLEEHKGVRFLLDAFEKLDIKANLIIAGEGSLSGLVKAAAEKNKAITYLGYIAMDQLLDCFEIADALLVPSLCYENSPTVIYESLQAGVPVLAANIGGVGELVQDDENGYLFGAGNEGEFLDTVKKLEAKRGIFLQERKKIHLTVAPYALTQYVDRLEQLIGELRNRKRK